MYVNGKKNHIEKTDIYDITWGGGKIRGKKGNRKFIFLILRAILHIILMRRRVV